ncbi:MAG: NCS2 family permease [Bacilli bacterium]|jgi:AGZA family xanthine/uracil permease-like MFS transporter
MYNFLNRVFKLEENHTTVRAEIVGGLTTFFAMCYIIIVNPNQMIGFSFDVPGIWGIWNACFVGGILAAVIATLCMAFLANKPFALAAGMGLNSFFFVSFILPCLIGGHSVFDGYGAGLAVILISGIIFLILSITGVRKHIATSLPTSLKCAIPAGIGLFIALIGFANSGIVVGNPYTFVALTDFSTWKSAAPALVAFIGLVVIVVLAKSKISWLRSSAVILGILVATACFYAFGLFDSEAIVKTSVGTVFSDWAKHGLFNLKFGKAFDGVTIGSVFSVIMLVITYCLVDIFDTLGTVYGTATEAGLVDENGDPQNLQEIMLSDAIGTVAGAVTGTSTITTFVESASGVASGARTGLASVVTSILFLLCLFVAPVAQYVPTAATAPALIYVGILMIKNITNVDFTDITNAATAFMTLAIMPLTYSISNGIMVGAITYVLLRLLTGKYNKKDLVVTGIAILAILKFVFVKM